MSENRSELFKQMQAQKTALGLAMQQAAKKSHVSNFGTQRSGLKDVASIGIDGVDHINIGDPSGVTELGQWLAHNTETPFKHHLLGQFDSVESLWHWVKSESRSDAYRKLYGKKLRTALNNDQLMKADLEKRGMVKNFRAIVCDANWMKICQYPALKQALGESDLPLDMYYVVNGSERNRPVFATWVVHGFEEIRSAIKEEREPDFKWALDKQDQPDVYVEERERLDLIKSQIQAAHPIERKQDLIAESDPIDQNSDDMSAIVDEAMAE